MIRHCNGLDPNLRDKDRNIGFCGATFDDVNHWTTCPHDEFPINPAVRELIGADTIAITPGDPAEPRDTESQPPADHHQHGDGSWHADVACIGPGPAAQRYLAAVRALASSTEGLAALQPTLTDPVALLAAISLKRAEIEGIVTVLVRRGLITAGDYEDAITASIEGAVRRAEADLIEAYGTRGVPR